MENNLETIFRNFIRVNHLTAKWDEFVANYPNGLPTPAVDESLDEIKKRFLAIATKYDYTDAMLKDKTLIQVISEHMMFAYNYHAQQSKDRNLRLQGFADQMYSDLPIGEVTAFELIKLYKNKYNELTDLLTKFKEI